MNGIIDIPYEKIDGVIWNISLRGLINRTWEIDRFKEDYQRSPKVLEYFESKLQAYVLKKTEYIDELQREIREHGDKDGFYLGEVFKALIHIGDNEKLQKIIADGVDVEVNIGLAKPLHVAADVGNIPAMKALIAAGADVNAQTVEGATPLHYCHWDKQATALLLKSGANPFICNIDGCPPWKLVNAAVAEAYLDEGYSFEPLSL